MTSATKNQEHDLALFPYIGRLDLDQAPFIANTSNQFFFSDPNIKQYLDLLRHLTQSSNLVPVVLSPKDGGKTSLLQAFIAQSDSNSKICTIDADQANDKLLILKEISKFFDIHFDKQDRIDESYLLHLLHEKAIELYQSGKYPVIAIENAQYLQDDACKLLLTLQHGIEDRENNWHILFFADCKDGDHPKLYNINLSEYPQLYILLLEPFTLEQTRNYIAHRLAAAGYKEEIPLTEENIKYIHLQSKGLPGKINELSHSALMRISSRNFGSQFDLNSEIPPTTKKRSSSFRRFFIGSLLVFGVAIILYLQDDINAIFGLSKQLQPPINFTNNNASSSADEKNRTTDIAIEKEHLPSNQDSKLLPEKLTSQSEPKAPQQIIKTSIDTIITPDSTPPEKIVISDKKTASSADVDSVKKRKLLPGNIHDENWLLNQKGSYTVQLLGISDEKILAKYLAENIVGNKFKHEIAYYSTTSTGNKGGGKHTLVYGIFATYYQARQAISKLPTPIKSNGPWPVKLDDVKKSISLQKELTKKKLTDTQLAPTNLKTKIKTIKNAVNSNIVDIEKDSTSSYIQEVRAWITGQNPDHFTIQLLSTSTEKPLWDYINKFKLQNNSVLYQTTRKNKDWYSLLYGVFDTRSKAESMVNNLPSEIISNKPWIRKMSGLQNEVRINSR